MIRLSAIDDANQLYILNEEFNGKGVVSFDILKKRLSMGSEIVVVCEVGGKLAGFVCAQIMKSFCYDKIYAEITEVFVTKEYRRRGYATQMLEYMQEYCKQNHNVECFQLFTGRLDKSAQKLYKSIGYRKDGAILFRK